MNYYILPKNNNFLIPYRFVNNNVEKYACTNVISSSLKKTIKSQISHQRNLPLGNLQPS